MAMIGLKPVIVNWDSHSIVRRLPKSRMIAAKLEKNGKQICVIREKVEHDLYSSIQNLPWESRSLNILPPAY